MTRESLAEKLNGSTYGSDLITSLEAEAKAAGLVIVTGYSDDNIEFNGAIYDEAPAYDGGEAVVFEGHVVFECDEPCRHCSAQDQLDNGHKIKAEWDVKGYSWFISADIPFSPFDVFEDGEKFCRGIVFNIKDTY